MSHFNDLWDWMAALKTSLPFAIALPILLATLFATLADWLEHYLARYQQATSQRQTDDPRASVRANQSRGVTPRGSPVFHGNGGRSEGC